MSSKSHRHHKKEAKNLPVTSRCVAIVLSPTQKVGDAGSNLDQRSTDFNPKNVLEDFKIRNRNCYWNPALVDSVKSLEYVGFLEPYTVLVKGDDIHLENVRTAWGRRVLKDPADFHIERIGDVNGIQMQVIPQTQFIPLPEALCLIIMDLNNNQIVATLDTVCEKLQLCYQGHHLPGNQLVYDTLGTLIRERKVFHTGFGYFVVTPDTFRLHAEDQLASTWNIAWTHLHPMYIPAAFSQPQKAPMRSISCQVDEEEKPVIGQNESGDLTEVGLPNSNAIQVDLPPPRLQRSMSLSVRRSREPTKKEETSEGGLKRSSSVKGRSESKGEVVSTDSEKTQQKPEKIKAEKSSLFSKLFGRNKKKAPIPAEPPKPAVEYATFSAQFPPPEWTWYQQQLEKHIRTETWVQQQVVKSDTWHHFQNIQKDMDVDCHAASERGTAPAGSYPTDLKQETKALGDDSFKREEKRHSSRSKTKHREKLSMVIANKQRERAVMSDHLNGYAANQANSVTMDKPGQRLRLSSLPTRLSPPGAVDMPHSDNVHPMFNSTPRWVNTYQDHQDQIENTVDQLQTKTVDPYMKRNSVRKSHKSKRRSLHEPQSNSTYQTEDISCEYQGRLPKKNSAIGVSRDSGVNCIGLDPKHTEMQEHKERGQRPFSFRETDLDYDLRLRHDQFKSDKDKPNSDQDRHIYANVEISQPVTSSSKRIIERPPHLDKDRPRRSASYRQYKSEKRKQNQTTDIQRLKLDSLTMGSYKTELNKLCEEHSDKVTLDSCSSQGKLSQNSAREGTCSSEQSVGTVIDARTAKHKQIHSLIAESHGDSGFSSPRVSEISSDSKKSEGSSKKSENKSKTTDCDIQSENCTKISKSDCKRRNSDLSGRQSDFKKNDSNLMREKKGFMCNNIKNAKPLNNSVGELDIVSDDSVFGRITPDALYENVKLDHAEVLNNMKYLHKETNVSSQNLNTPQPDVTADAVETFDFKQPGVSKFKLEGDFHVVGVV